MNFSSKILPLILVISASACGHKTPSLPTLPTGTSLLEEASLAQSEAKLVHLTSGQSRYSVLVHSARIQPLIKGSYQAQDLSRLKDHLATSLAISVSPQGLAQAADRELQGSKDDTNYDAVWLRDSLWIYLGLKKSKPAQATKILSRMLDYLASEKQLARMDQLIQSQKILTTPEAASMAVIHIRFNGKSESFEDVSVDGKPQPWNHKQNDALGLFYDLTLRALQSGEIALSSLNNNHWRVLTGLPCYFESIKFYQMEEAGPWEEIDRVNTSSIALVTSGLENLSQLMSQQNSPVQNGLQSAAKSSKHSRCLSSELVRNLVNSGYSRIHKQIKAGGESPLYPLDSPKYRRADAALLNAIYPARLSKLSLEEKKSILAIIQPLIGRVGVKRYLSDSYQSGNFWLQKSTDNSADSRTDDSSSDEHFAQRGSQFIADTEAQWFFDSWLSVIYAKLHRETKTSEFRDLQLQYFNRALGQLTGGDSNHKWVAADGKPIPAFVPPESYNQLVQGDKHLFVSSPIVPLNWAKASLQLALEEIGEK
jgi:hypothetical protein